MYIYVYHIYILYIYIYMYIYAYTYIYIYIYTSFLILPDGVWDVTNEKKPPMLCAELPGFGH